MGSMLAIKRTNCFTCIIYTLDIKNEINVSDAETGIKRKEYKYNKIAVEM